MHICSHWCERARLAPPQASLAARLPVSKPAGPTALMPCACLARLSGYCVPDQGPICKACNRIGGFPQDLREQIKHRVNKEIDEGKHGDWQKWCTTWGCQGWVSKKQQQWCTACWRTWKDRPKGPRPPPEPLPEEPRRSRSPRHRPARHENLGQLKEIKLILGQLKEVLGQLEEVLELLIVVITEPAAEPHPATSTDLSRTGAYVKL